MVGSVDGQPVNTLINGVLRGMIRPGIPVTKGLKIGDIDPRGVKEHCYTISEKALAISGGVLEGILIRSTTATPSSPLRTRKIKPFSTPEVVDGKPTEY